MIDLCDCNVCSSGAPSQFKVSIGAPTNGTCSDCADFEGDYVLDYDIGVACHWVGHAGFSPSICGYGSTQFSLVFEVNVDGTVDLSLDIVALDVTYKKTDIFNGESIGNCFPQGGFKLSKQSELGDCTWPPEVTVYHVGNETRPDLKASTCIAAGHRSVTPCPPGTTSTDDMDAATVAAVGGAALLLQATAAGFGDLAD